MESYTLLMRKKTQHHIHLFAHQTDLWVDAISLKIPSCLWNSQNNYKMCIGGGSAKISIKRNSQAIVEKENSKGIALPDTELNLKSELIVSYWSRNEQTGNSIIEQQTQKRPTYSIWFMVLGNTAWRLVSTSSQ